MEHVGIDTRTTWILRIAAAVAIVAGVIARVRHLLETPLWLDEAYSRFAAEHGWWFLWHVIPRYETHPPLYYSLLHIWQAAAGESLLAYRLPGLLCGFLTIIVTGLAAQALADRAAATSSQRTMIVTFAVGYAAMAPMLVSMSRQVRPYPLMVLVYAVATLALLRLANDAAAGRALSRRWIAGFFAAETAMLWLHALGPLIAVAQSLALALVVVRRKMPFADRLWLMSGQAAAGLVYLPALAILRAEAPTWVHSTWLTFDPASVPDQIMSLFAAPWHLLELFVLLAFAGGVAQFVRLEHMRRTGAALLVLTALPVTLSLLLSWWVAPVFLPRTLSPCIVPFTLIIAMLGMTAGSRLMPLVLMALLLALTARYDFDGDVWVPVEDWYGTVDWIAPKLQPGDVVWSYPNETALPLGYALQDRHRAWPIRQIPAPVPAFDYPGDHPTGNGGVVAARPLDMVRIASDGATTRSRRIWLASLTPEGIDPPDALLHALLRNRTIGRHYRTGGIRILELVARPADPARPGRAAPAAAAAAR